MNNNFTQNSLFVIFHTHTQTKKKYIYTYKTQQIDDKQMHKTLN